MHKTPLLFIPGTLCNSAMFNQHIDYVRQRYPSLSPNAVEFSSENTLQAMADTVLNAVHHKPFIMLGFSMGGFVALHIAKHYPALCKGIILLNSNAHGDLPGREAIRNEHLKQAKDTSLRELINTLYMPNYLANNNPQLVKMILDMAQKCGIDTFENQLKVLANRPDASKTLSTLQCPLLLIGGDSDTLCPVSEQQRMFQLNPNAQLNILADAGHFSLLEQPQAFRRALSNWLEQMSLL